MTKTYERINPVAYSPEKPAATAEPGAMERPRRKSRATRSDVSTAPREARRSNGQAGRIPGLKRNAAGSNRARDKRARRTGRRLERRPPPTARPAVNLRAIPRHPRRRARAPVPRARCRHSTGALTLDAPLCGTAPGLQRACIKQSSKRLNSRRRRALYGDKAIEQPISSNCQFLAVEHRRQKRSHC